MPSFRTIALSVVCCLLFLFNVYSIKAQSPTMGLLLNDTAGVGGYTLFRQMQYNNTYLIDEFGRTVHTWDNSAYSWYLTPYLLPDGDLLLMVNVAYGAHLVELDWDGNIVWDFMLVDSTVKQHHDIAPLPNGNVLIVQSDRHLLAEVVQAGRDTTGFTDTLIWTEKIIEVEKTGSTSGNVVWEWRIWDHLVQDFDPTKDNYGVIADHPELVDINSGHATSTDWLHMNAMDYNPDLDQIVMSPRWVSEFWIVDHSTTTAEAANHTGGDRGKGGDILYRWGNPQIYAAGDSTDQQLIGQHDPNWIPAGYPGAGNILVFNNAWPNRNYSSVLEIETPVDANGDYPSVSPGTAYGPAAPVWEWTNNPPESTYSIFISSARRLKNGNTQIDDGAHGTFLEVQPSNDIVWKYKSPIAGAGPLTQGQTFSGNFVFRAYHFDADYSAFTGRDLTPTSCLELNPVTVSGAGTVPTEPMGNADIAITADVTADLGLSSIDVFVDAGSGYASYTMLDDGLNGDGLAGDGKYGALIGSYDDLTLIEYYFEAVDDTASLVYDPPNPPRSVYRFTVGYSCGNIDGVLTGGNPTDITDLTYLVDYLFNGGPAPVNMSAANIDGIITGGNPVDINDLTYLVDFLFGGGPAPSCM